MAACLILGLAGAGKSTLVTELQNRCRIAYDADGVDKLGAWHDMNGQPQVYRNDQSWRRWHTYDWDPSVMEMLIAQPQELVYVAGTATNWMQVAYLFDYVVGLRTFAHDIRLRRQYSDRCTPNQFNSNESMDAIREVLAQFERDMHQVGGQWIDAARNVPAIAEELITLVELIPTRKKIAAMFA
jgi:hypothetical protein